MKLALSDDKYLYDYNKLFYSKKYTAQFQIITLTYCCYVKRTSRIKQFFTHNCFSINIHIQEINLNGNRMALGMTVNLFK